MSQRRASGTFLIFAALSSMVSIPIISGRISMPSVAAVLIPSAIFAFCMVTASLITQSLTRQPAFLGAGARSVALLVIGMPLSLLSGAMAVVVTDQHVPSSVYYLGDIGASFFLGELCACIVWSLTLYFCQVALPTQQYASSLLTIAGVIVLVMLCANLSEVVSQKLLHKACLLPLLIMSEQIASGLIIGNKIAPSERA